MRVLFKYREIGGRKWLDNLRLGYGGTQAEMQRLLADATALSGVEYDISNLGDVYAAIHVIQQDLGLTGVAAQEASETFTGSFGAMKAAAENLMANLALGNDISADLATLSASVQNFLFNNLFPMIGNIMTQIPTVVEQALGFVIQAISQLGANAPAILQAGVGIVTQLASALISAVPNLITAAGSMIASLGQAILAVDWVQVATDLTNSFMTALDGAAALLLGTDTNFIGSLADGVIAGLPTVVESIGTIMDGIWTFLVEQLPVMLEKGVDMVTSFVDGLVQNLPAITEAITTMASKSINLLMTNGPTLLEKGVQLIGKLAAGLLKNLPAILKAIGTIVVKLIAEIAKNLPKFLQKGIELVGKIAAGIIKAIPEILGAAGKAVLGIGSEFTKFNWLEIGSGIINGIKTGVTNMAGSLVNTVKNVGSSVLAGIKSFFGIHSPSTVFRDQIGENLVLGLAKGLSDTAPVTDAMHDLAASATGTIKADLGVAGSLSGIGSAASGGTVTNMGGVAINVNGYNKDPRELAKQISEILAQQNRRYQAAYG